MALYGGCTAAEPARLPHASLVLACVWGRVVEFRILGPLEVVAGGRPLVLGGGRQRALLAVLLLHRNEVVPVDWLIDALWGERPARTAANLVHVYVSRLRKALPAPERDRVVTSSGGYLLRVDADELDLDRFERLAEQGRRALLNGEPQRASALLAEALALWHGPALSDFTFQAFAQREIARLEELRLAAMEERIEAELACGRHALLVAELEALVDEHPYRERLRGQLLLALYRSGRQAEALERYRQTRAAFVEELGIDPGPELQQLEHAILAHDPTLAVPAPVATADGEKRTSNLPVPPTALVGRDRELHEVVTLLRGGCRLLTLTGPGGTGKTRLALEAAAELQEEFHDGVWWVSLARVREPGHVAAAIAETLGTGEELERSLARRQALLLLDNFEHVLEAATTVSSLLAAAPRLVVLATSREPLHLAAEREYPVPSLTERQAVSLFNERARAVRPDFAAEGIVAEICRRLDHLPLAIELAAARVRMLSPALLLHQLEDRFQLLADGPRDVPPRQQSLHATLDWSYALLRKIERLVFGQLSVFVGGFTIGAARQVCADDEDTFAVLTSLVEKNLVRRTDDVAGDPRFTLLETIREYAAEQLGEKAAAEQTRERHARYYAALADELHGQVTAQGESHDLARALFKVERGNLHASLAWFSRAGDTEALLRLAGCREIWFPGLVTEGRRMLAKLLDRSADLESPGRLRALRAAAPMAIFQRDAEEGVRLCEEAAALAGRQGEDRERLAALITLQGAAAELDDVERAGEAAREAERLARKVGDWTLAAGVLINRSYLEASHGQYASARRGFTEALALLLEHGGAAAPRAITMQNLALISLEEGRLTEAAELVAGALGILDPDDSGYDSVRDDCLETFAAIAAATGDHRTGVRIAAAAQGWRNTEGAEQLRWERAIHDRMIEASRTALSHDDFVASSVEGAKLGLREAAAEAVGWSEQRTKPAKRRRERRTEGARARR